MTRSKSPYVIVVGTDYSRTADLALTRALELASIEANAEVHVVNVVHALPGAPYGMAVSNAFVPDGAFGILVADTERKVQEFNAHRGDAQPFSRVVCHLRIEAAAEQIAQLAADLDAELVVVGTHGRRGVSRLLLGSVAEATVRLSPCPVLVVRPKAIPQVLASIEPPCPRCLEAREKSEGRAYWCEQHSERHGQRHTYHQSDRVSADGSFPLLYR